MGKRKSYRRSGGGAGMGKLIKFAAIGAAVSLVGASVLPNVDNRLKAAAAGFVMGGGPIGAIAAAGGAMLAPNLLGSSGTGGIQLN